MLKSKAVSLARLGESVTYIFLGGRRDMEAVMTVATRLQMAQYPTITVLSLRDLVTYHSSHRSHTRLSSLLPTPSPLTLLQFYLTWEKPTNTFIDEVPLETQWDIIRQPATALVTYLSHPDPVWINLIMAAVILPPLISAVSLAVLAAHFSPWSLLLLLLPLVALLLLSCTNKSVTYLTWLLAILSLASLASTILALLHTPWSLLHVLGFLPLWPVVGLCLLP